ncbi:MAG: hypothetical protein LBI95_00090 [Holosporales bacterium]|jgi:hypothetical protein|nr:hypothetical protein [Holosporales bacterium]
MKKISSAISSIIGTMPTLSLSIAIKSSWNDIVGDELSNFMAFSVAKYTGKNELSVIVKMISSASVLAKYNTSNIIYNLSKLTGIEKVKLIFQHTSSLMPDGAIENIKTETEKYPFRNEIKIEKK